MNTANYIVNAYGRVIAVTLNVRNYATINAKGKSERRGSIIRFPDGSAITFVNNKPVEFVG